MEDTAKGCHSWTTVHILMPSNTSNRILLRSYMKRQTLSYPKRFHTFHKYWFCKATAVLM